MRERLLRELADVVGLGGRAGGRVERGSRWGAAGMRAGRRWVAVQEVAACKRRHALRTGVGGKRDLPRPSYHTGGKAKRGNRWGAVSVGAVRHMVAVRGGVGRGAAADGVRPS